MSDLTFGTDFPATTRAQWREAVDAVLKDASFDTVMRTRTAEGLVIEPVYQRAVGRAPLIGREPGSRWAVIQRVDHPDPGIANELALTDLEGGADGLALVFAGASPASSIGLAAETVGALSRALDGILLDIISIRLDAGRRARAAGAIFAAFASRDGGSLSKLRFSLGYDPVGVLAARGRLSAPWPIFEQRIASTVEGLAGLGHRGPVLMMDGRVYHTAGASRALELGAMLATGVAYLRALEGSGLSLADARGKLEAVITADTDAFMTIASVRALRLLWARIEDILGLPPEKLPIHAESAWRSLAIKDPWSNMLRGAIAAFAAGLGGADSVTVLPFTAALGVPDAFARRVARNAQHVLMAEAHLHHFADPAAGSGALEGLTDALAEAAWNAFRSIEAEGGIVEALKSGYVAQAIAHAREVLAKPVVVGVNRFPNPDPAPVATLSVSPPALSAGTSSVAQADDFASLVGAAAHGATLGDLSPTSQPDALRAPALVPIRDGEGT